MKLLSIVNNLFFRVWGHQDDDDGRIYKTKLSNELNQFKSSIEHNTLDPIVKAAFIKELTNMKFASHIQERPDIKPIIEQHDKRPYDQDNQESSEMLNKIKYVTPIYDPDDYRIGPRYQPEVPVPSTNGSSPDPRPRHMQYSSLTNKPLYKVSPFTHPPAPAMNPLKVKDNYAPVVEEEPIFTYSPPKHHPPGFKPNTVKYDFSLLFLDGCEAVRMVFLSKVKLLCLKLNSGHIKQVCLF